MIEYLNTGSEELAWVFFVLGCLTLAFLCCSIPVLIEFGGAGGGAIGAAQGIFALGIFFISMGFLASYSALVSSICVASVMLCLLFIMLVERRKIRMK